MGNKELPEPDKYGIIRLLPLSYTSKNKQLLRKFNINPVIYDFSQDKIVRSNIHKANTKRHYEFLRSELENLKGKQILDIACGTGSIIKYLDSSNYYTGLDISHGLLKKAIKRAKSKKFKKIMLIEGTAEELNFLDCIFDFIICNTALHMIPDYKKAIQECSRVLIAGGYFLGCCPVTGINIQFDEKWKKVVQKRKTIHSLKEQDIKSACEISDLEYRRIGTNGGLLYFRSEK